MTKQVTIPLEQVRHVRMRLKQITFGDCMSMSDSSFDALVEAIKLLDTGVKNVEESR